MALTVRACAECAICSGAENGGRYVAVECGHVFHKDCLAKWCNKGKATCPHCRQPTKAASWRPLFLESVEDRRVETLSEWAEVFAELQDKVADSKKEVERLRLQLNEHEQRIEELTEAAAESERLRRSADKRKDAQVTELEQEVLLLQGQLRSLEAAASEARHRLEKEKRALAHAVKEKERALAAERAASRLMKGQIAKHQMASNRKLGKEEMLALVAEVGGLVADEEGPEAAAAAEAAAEMFAAAVAARNRDNEELRLQLGLLTQQLQAKDAAHALQVRL